MKTKWKKFHSSPDWFYENIETKERHMVCCCPQIKNGKFYSDSLERMREFEKGKIIVTTLDPSYFYIKGSDLDKTKKQIDKARKLYKPVEVSEKDKNKAKVVSPTGYFYVKAIKV